MPRKKSPVTRPGIDPGTFRLVAQRLNHCATPGPTEKRGYCILKEEVLDHSVWRTRVEDAVDLSYDRLRSE
jgi:hypothetical protein